MISPAGDTLITMCALNNHVSFFLFLLIRIRGHECWSIFFYRQSLTSTPQASKLRAEQIAKRLGGAEGSRGEGSRAQ